MRRSTLFCVTLHVPLLTLLIYIASWAQHHLPVCSRPRQLSPQPGYHSNRINSIIINIISWWHPCDADSGAVLKRNRVELIGSDRIGPLCSRVFLNTTEQ